MPNDILRLWYLVYVIGQSWLASQAVASRNRIMDEHAFLFR